MNRLDPRRFGILGDVHTLFREEDVEVLDARGYDAILAVGDLASLKPNSDIDTARRMARLKTPTYLHPGNHDGVTPPQLLAEVIGSDVLSRWFGLGQKERVGRLRAAIEPHVLTGYSLHPIAEGAVDLVAGRPHSFGGRRLSCVDYLSDSFGVDSMEASTAKLKSLLAETSAPDVLVMGHNGPFGLGTEPTDIWGCDFKPEKIDFGDPDLSAALANSPARGRVRAVVAGHMHHRVKGKRGFRSWSETRDGILYVNAASVPRIEGKEQPRGHHVRLTLEPGRVQAEQVWIDLSSGEETVTATTELNRERSSAP